MERLRSPKVCAALVMIAWLASAISVWGMTAAGARAIGSDTSCTPGDLDGVGVRLEMASEPGQVPEILGGDPSSARAACLRRGEAAVVRADTAFLVSYSLLNLALFLFVRALRAASGRTSLQALLPVLGVVLAAAMAAGDLVENRHLLDVIRLAGQDPLPPAVAGLLPGLHLAAYVKMGALALAAALLAALWPSGSRWILLLRLLGFAAAAVFAYGMAMEDADVIGKGMGVFAAFWFAALVHAIATMAGRKPYSAPSQLPPT